MNKLMWKKGKVKNKKTNLMMRRRKKKTNYDC